jgi:hypothetical protein
VAAIEKLLGQKIARVGGGRAEEPAADAKKPARPTEAKESAPRRKAPAKKPKPADRSPVVEDIKGEWNGPLPGFLSHSAG